MNIKTLVCCFLSPVSCILSTGTYNLGHKIPSTTVEVSRQISLFLQNKPNSPNVQLNASLFITIIYTIFISLTKVKNKANSNPKQSQFPKDQK